MPSDASIYGQIQPMRSPAETQSQILQLRQLMDAQGLNALTLQEKQREIAEGQKMRDLFSRGNVTSDELSAINPNAGAAYRKSQLEIQKSEAELARTKAETLLKQAAYLRDSLAGVNDQAGYDRWLEEGARLFGPDAARKNPPQFSPELKQALLAKADDMIVPLAKKLELDSQRRGQDLGAETTRRGQDMTQATAIRGQDQPIWDSERGSFITRPNRPVSPPFAGAPSAQAPQPAAAPVAAPQAPAVTPVPGLPAKPVKYGQPYEATGPDGKPRLVMQNQSTGEIVDANTRQPLQGVGPKLGETAQKQQVGVQNTKNAIQSYLSELEKFSMTDIVNPNARARMGTVYNNMLLQAKEAFNLGVLNGPDYQILQEVITNPASLKGGITSKEALADQAAKLSEIMSRVGETITETQSGRSPASPAAAPKPRFTRAEIDAELRRRGVTR